MGAQVNHELDYHKNIEIQGLSDSTRSSGMESPMLASVRNA